MSELKIGDYVCPHCSSNGPLKGYVTIYAGDITEANCYVYNMHSAKPGQSIDALPFVDEYWGVGYCYWLHGWPDNIKDCEKFSCPDCGKYFQKPLFIERADHLMRLTSEPKIGDYVCPHCSSKCPYEGYLTVDEEDFFCRWHEVCLVEFVELDPSENYLGQSFFAIPICMTPTDEVRGLAYTYSWNGKWVNMENWDKFSCPSCGMDFQEPLLIKNAHQLMRASRH